MKKDTDGINEAMATDDNNRSVPVGSGILTTYNGVSSPLTLVGGAITPISTPVNGMELSIDNCSTDLEISEDPAMISYTTLPANASRVIGTGGSSIIYVKSQAGGTLNFSIVTV